MFLSFSKKIWLSFKSTARALANSESLRPLRLTLFRALMSFLIWSVVNLFVFSYKLFDLNRLFGAASGFVDGNLASLADARSMLLWIVGTAVVSAFLFLGVSFANQSEREVWLKGVEVVADDTASLFQSAASIGLLVFLFYARHVDILLLACLFGLTSYWLIKLALMCK